jgi:hypothetical protein
LFYHVSHVLSMAVNIAIMFELEVKSYALV